MRKKGSKNKPKVTLVNKKDVPEGLTKEVLERDIVVEEPRPKVEVCQCSHNQSLHYGSKFYQCNTQGCGCLELR